jgi:hypothetical protein
MGSEYLTKPLCLQPQNAENLSKSGRKFKKFVKNKEKWHYFGQKFKISRKAQGRGAHHLGAAPVYVMHPAGAPRP